MKRLAASFVVAALLAIAGMVGYGASPAGKVSATCFTTRYDDLVSFKVFTLYHNGNNASNVTFELWQDLDGCGNIAFHSRITDASTGDVDNLDNNVSWIQGGVRYASHNSCSACSTITSYSPWMGGHGTADNADGANGSQFYQTWFTPNPINYWTPSYQASYVHAAF